MECVNDHGSFSDFPYDLLIEKYPHDHSALINSKNAYNTGDLDEEIKKLDVYIHPEIFQYSVVDFDKKIEILEKGTIEASKFEKIFKEIANKQTVKRKRKIIEYTEKKLLVSNIEIYGSENYTRAYVLGKLNMKTGDSLSRKDITKKIGLLSATRNYDRIEYNFIEKADGSFIVDFLLKESKENATLKLGAHYDLLYKSGVLAKYSRKNLIANNDLLSLDVVLGDNIRYNLNYFVDNGFYVSYGFKSRYNHFRDNAKFKAVDTARPGEVDFLGQREAAKKKKRSEALQRWYKDYKKFLWKSYGLEKIR